MQSSQDAFQIHASDGFGPGFTALPELRKQAGILFLELRFVLFPFVTGQFQRGTAGAGEFLPGLCFVRLAGGVKKQFQLRIRSGRLHQGFRVFERAIKNLFSLRNEPGAKIIKPVIRASAIDDVGRRPKIAVVRRAHLLVKQPVKIQNLPVGEGLEFLLNQGDLLAAIPLAFRPGRFDQMPEVIFVHSVSPVGFSFEFVSRQIMTAPRILEATNRIFPGPPAAAFTPRSDTSRGP